MLWLQPVAASLLGLWAAILAHQGWGNFHDGVRPALAEQAEGDLARDELVRVARDANRPFVAGGLGLSILAGVPLSHWLWLPAESAGFRCRRLWAAALAGAIWGALAWAVVWGGRSVAPRLPVSLSDAFDQAAQAILASGMFFPALAAGHRFGVAAGMAALAASAAGAAFGLRLLDAPRLAAATAGAMLAGILFFLVLVARARSDASALDGPPARARRAPCWALVVQGALLALAVRAGTFGWSTADGVAAALQWWGTGATVALALAVAFAPQWAAALGGTGVAQSVGLGGAVIAGFLAPSPAHAPLLGAVAATLELRLGHVLARRPELREAGESLRWAAGKTGHAGVLAGAVWAGAALLPAGLGMAVVVAAVGLNDLLSKGVWNSAAPAWGLVLAGALANLWVALGGR